MLNIAKLFGKSPFAPLQTHMEKVSLCIKELKNLFYALSKRDMKEIQEVAKKISQLEHEADITKNEIRNHLPKSLFLPIDRNDFLQILHLQDSFADAAEDIAIISTLKILENYDDMKEKFELFCNQNIEAFDLSKRVIEEFDSLLESSFGGIEAERVKMLTDQLAFVEHELDILGYELLKDIYTIGDKMRITSFNLWLTLLKEIGNLSNIGDQLGEQIRMILEARC